jgi:hypothetical protein
MHMKMNLLWKFKQWWSSIPQILTKRTITSHLNWTYWSQKINKTYVVGNPRPSMWQVQQCGCVKLLDSICVAVVLSIFTLSFTSFVSLCIVRFKLSNLCIFIVCLYVLPIGIEIQYIQKINKNNKYNSNYPGGSKLELMFLINWQSFLNFDCVLLLIISLNFKTLILVKKITHRNWKME